MNDTASAIDFIKTVDSSGIMLNLDVGTIIENDENLEVVEKNFHLVHHVHISEHYLNVLEKRCDLHKKLRRILDKHNYSGFVSIEMKKGSDIKDIGKRYGIYSFCVRRLSMGSFIAYAIFGILTTIINIVSYYVSYSILSIPNVPSTILAWVLAVIFAFVTNKLWVFDSPSFDQRTLRHEIPTFLGVRIGTGILDVAIMYVAVDVTAWPSLFWKCVSNMIVIVLNYVASKLIIFRRGNTLYIAIEMTDFETPIRIDGDADYVPEVTKQLERYREFVEKVVARNINATGTYPNLVEKQLYEHVSQNINTINTALDKYFNGKPAQAYSLILDYISRYRESPFFVANINENYAFKSVAPEKLRPSIYEKTYKEDHEAILRKDLYFYKSRISDRRLSRIDMLHVPFDKRDITKN